MVPKVCCSALVFIFLISAFVCFYFEDVSSIIPASYMNINILSSIAEQHFTKEKEFKIRTTESTKRKPIWGEIPFSFDTQCLLGSNPNISWDNFPEENLDFLSTEEGKEYKKILAWHWAYVPHYYFGFGRKPFETACCKEKRCFLTARRDVIPLKEFDALIFQHYGLFQDMIPKIRSPHQRWIFYEREPPTLSFGHTKFFNGLFNWTMTYRRDSDIFAGYGYVFPKSLFYLPRNETEAKIYSVLNEQLQNRTKMAAWFVSHCKTESLRENFVSTLQNYLQVDVYGKCGNMTCSPLNKTLCYKMLEKNYKFYLSFENSLCKDYVTEKFFNIMSFNVIPVVFGSADYDSVAPPHSYINARNFTSVKHLADYMIYLSNNNTAYLEYFKWKTDFLINSMSWITSGINFCNLCQRLHENHPKKIYSNIKDWYITKSNCINLYPK